MIPTGSWANVSLAVWNAGGLRASIGQGNITRRMLWYTFPFRNTMIQVTLPGSAIKDMFEHSVAAIEKSKGQFLQVSGIIVTYDTSKPVGKRVADIKVRCSKCAIPVFEPLHLATNYNILLNKYMYDGGDGYAMLKKSAVDSLYFGSTVWSIMAAYIPAHPEITTAIEGRIRFRGDGSEPCSSGSRPLSISPLLLASALLIGRTTQLLHNLAN